MSAPDPKAVYFSPGDYAGFWGRLVVEVGDVRAVRLLIVVVTAIVALVDPADEPSADVLAIMALAWLASIYWYFVILKSTANNVKADVD